MIFEIQDITNKTRKVVHFDRLKGATVKPRVHKLSKNEQIFFSKSAKEEDSSDFTWVKRQFAKLVNAKIDAVTP